MPGYARQDLVTNDVSTYHVWTRCVQQQFLLGKDPADPSAVDYSYRREWSEKLLIHLLSVMALDCHGYAILGNHEHATMTQRPDLVAGMSDEEVAWRWKMMWPKWDFCDRVWYRDPTDAEIERLLGNAEKLGNARIGLSSLSMFCARWKEPISRMANNEMGTKGAFWEGRFGSRKLEDTRSILTCCLYQDMNQIRAGMATGFADSEYCSIRRRMATWNAKLDRGDLSPYEQEFARWFVSSDFDLAAVDDRYADCYLAPICVSSVPTGLEASIQLAVAANERERLLYGSVPTRDYPEEVAERLVSTSGEDWAQSVERELPEYLSDAEQGSGREEEAVVVGDEGGFAERQTSGRDALARCDQVTQFHHQRRKAGQSYVTDRRMRVRRRRRASELAMCEIRPDEYQQCAIWLLERHYERPKPFPDLAVLQKQSENPEVWAAATIEFQQWFGRSVGAPHRVEKAARAAGKSWFHGIQRCRDALSDNDDSGGG